jgi:AmmeMemoRadiSam system protein B
MKVRKRGLPPGWYPEAARETRREIEQMAAGTEIRPSAACAGIIPHAGWTFSGRLALEVLTVLCRGIDTIVIIGGHMGPADRIVSASEDAYETPLGDLRADTTLRERLAALMDIEEDRERDNTVEIHLPLVRFLSPGLLVLGMRAPPSPIAASLGDAITDAAAALGRRVAVAGSTDLTHYGSNYGFAPAGRGAEALKWVREINDRRIVDRMLALDVEEAITRARRERSACSVGGAAAAMAFARRSGVDSGTLVRYATSWDVAPAESFVGYAGILYP